MGCDSIIRARSAVQMLVLCLCLQHASGSLSVPSAINNSNKDSESDQHDYEDGIAKSRITRDERRNRHKYEDYSDNVVSSFFTVCGEVSIIAVS